MESTESLLRKLFQRYLENQLTPEEYDLFWDLLSSEAAYNNLTGELRSLWEQSGASGESIPAARWDQEIQQRLGREIVGIIPESESNLPGIPAHRRQVPRKHHFYWWKAAAVFLVMAGAGVVGALVYRHHPDPIPAQTLVAVAGGSAHPGTHASLTLPDGSTVVLNTNSKLSYASGFNSRNREVYLEGEGYFDISQQADLPFIVHSGSITVRVLGTAFNIQAYPGEDKISVTVTRGKVQVRDDKRSLAILTLNQQVIYDKGTASYRQNGIDADAVSAWRQKDLVFDNITLEEAAEIISQRFHVNIAFSHERLKGCHVTASFLSRHGIDQVLMVLCKLTDATYSIHGNTILLQGEGCN